MSRYDKYDPKDGGYRSPLAVARSGAAAHQTALGVGHDVNGRALPGGNQTGIKGVLVTTSDKAINDPVDIMTDGEIVEFPGVPGTNYFADPATGVLSAGTGVGTATPPVAGADYIGHTVEATRLIVRVGRTP